MPLRFFYVCKSRGLAGEPGMKQQTYISFQPGNLSRGAGSEPSTEVFPTLKSDHGRGRSDQDPHVAVAFDMREGGAQFEGPM
jgi:hypothetical protein